MSEIGLGCWQLGGDFGPLDQARSQEILQAAHENAIDFWDTADVYGNGLSERRIAEYVSNSPARPVIATKVGRGATLYPDGYTKAAVRAGIESSAGRLGVDCLDLVQLHCVPPAVLKDGEIFAWMEDFQTRGLIRAFGASVETIDEAKLAASHPRVTSLQIIFNLFRQNAIAELFPMTLANDIGIIVRLPLASGVLSGKMARHRSFAESDHRHYNRRGQVFSQGETFSGISFGEALDLVEIIRPRVPKGMTMAQMAMRWILDHPAVSTVIAGVSRPEQAVQNAGVSDLDRLPDALHRTLADFYVRDVEPRIGVPV